MGQDNEARRGDPACVALEAIEKAMRDHIKVDATGLSPAVASAYVVGFQEAAKAVAEIIARQAEALQRENAELREALEPFADVQAVEPVEPDWWLVTTEMGKVIFHGPDKDRAERVAAMRGRPVTPLYTTPSSRNALDKERG